MNLMSWHIIISPHELTWHNYDIEFSHVVAALITSRIPRPHPVLPVKAICAGVGLVSETKTRAWCNWKMTKSFITNKAAFCILFTNYVLNAWWFPPLPTPHWVSICGTFLVSSLFVLFWAPLPTQNPFYHMHAMESYWKFMESWVGLRTWWLVDVYLTTFSSR